MMQESSPNLISGETGIVHVPVARAAAILHTARNWRALTVCRVARAGEHPRMHGFEDHPIVPKGHVAIQILWRQYSPDDHIGVPIAFHHQANDAFMRSRIWWHAVAAWSMLFTRRQQISG